MIISGIILQARSQNVSTRTNEFEVDFSDPAKLVKSIIPVINWTTPDAENIYVADAKYKINVTVTSAIPLKGITIIIK